MKLHDGPIIVHVRGTIPYAVNGWTRPYATEAIARAQIEHLFDYPRKHRPTDTDWTATIYLFSPHAIRAVDVVDARRQPVRD